MTKIKKNKLNSTTKIQPNQKKTKKITKLK